jgi:integrase
MRGRAANTWIADDSSRSTIKNSLAVLVRVMEQAVRDGILERNPARITGWQHQFRKAEDELDDPRSLALPDWATLTRLADALVARSADQHRGWGDVTIFAACTAARIAEVSGCRIGDIDTTNWLWTVRRQTTPSPGGLVDKGTKGKRARVVPLIADVRDLIQHRIDTVQRREKCATVHRTPWRPHHHRGPPRRDPLGRGRELPRPRAPPPPRPAPHRADLDGRCRRPRTHPARHRRPRIAHDDPALPAPHPTQHHRCR